MGLQKSTKLHLLISPLRSYDKVIKAPAADYFGSGTVNTGSAAPCLRQGGSGVTRRKVLCIIRAAEKIPTAKTTRD